MVDKQLICRICSKQVANSNNVLARHVRTAHDTEWSDYVVTYDFGGVWPTCACGCGHNLEWKKGGFAKYVKGHDNRGQQNARVQHDFVIGWNANPFTGRDEFLRDDDEVAFLKHCCVTNDAVTRDHGIKIAWVSSAGAKRTLEPGFKHVQKGIIFMLDAFDDVDGMRRLDACRKWCDDNTTTMLMLKHTQDGFEVIGHHRKEG